MKNLLKPISAATALYFGLLMSANAQESGYKTSSCYQEFAKVYQDAVARRIDNLKFRRDLAFQTGIILNQSEPSDWGEEEKSIVNAADLTPSYNASKINNENSLNAFSYIHHEVLKDYPQMSPHQTRDYIRRGFEEGEFCSELLIFKFRSSRRKVARWIRKRVEDDLESSAISFAQVSDSELDKSEFLDESEQQKTPQVTVEEN